MNTPEPRLGSWQPWSQACIKKAQIIQNINHCSLTGLPFTTEPDHFQDSGGLVSSLEFALSEYYRLETRQAIIATVVASFQYLDLYVYPFFLKPRV